MKQIGLREKLFGTRVSEFATSMEQNGTRVRKFRTRLSQKGTHENQFCSSIKQLATRVELFWIREWKKDLKLVHVRLSEALTGLGPSDAEPPRAGAGPARERIGGRVCSACALCGRCPMPREGLRDRQAHARFQLHGEAALLAPGEQAESEDDFG